jgi:hypothetical protein
VLVVWAWRMSGTHVFLRCMHPQLESAREEILGRSDCREGRRQKSIGQLVGKEKRDWIVWCGIIWARETGFGGGEILTKGEVSGMLDLYSVFTSTFMFHMF